MIAVLLRIAWTIAYSLRFVVQDRLHHNVFTELEDTLAADLSSSLADKGHRIELMQQEIDLLRQQSTGQAASDSEGRQQGWPLAAAKDPSQWVLFSPPGSAKAVSDCLRVVAVTDCQ